MPKNNILYQIIDEIDTIPSSIAVAGTITTDNTSVNSGRRVFGTGTDFGASFQNGDWIFVEDELEVRRVVKMVSPTEIWVDEAFSSSLAGATFKRVTRQSYKSISVVTDSGTPTVDSVPFPVGKSVTFENVNKGANVGGQKRHPLVVDATGAQLTVAAQR